MCVNFSLVFDYRPLLLNALQALRRTWSNNLISRRIKLLLDVATSLLRHSQTKCVLNPAFVANLSWKLLRRLQKLHFEKRAFFQRKRAWLLVSWVYKRRTWLNLQGFSNIGISKFSAFALRVDLRGVVLAEGVLIVGLVVGAVGVFVVCLAQLLAGHLTGPDRTGVKTLRLIL